MLFYAASGNSSTIGSGSGQLDLDTCVSNPCQNNGTCSDVINGYACTCISGYTGTACQTDIDECESAPCHNQGTCSDMVDGYTCQCFEGYTGTKCETQLDDCCKSCALLKLCLMTTEFYTFRFESFILFRFK